MHMIPPKGCQYRASSCFIKESNLGTSHIRPLNSLIQSYCVNRGVSGCVTYSFDLKKFAFSPSINSIQLIVTKRFKSKDIPFLLKKLIQKYPVSII